MHAENNRIHVYCEAYAELIDSFRGCSIGILIGGINSGNNASEQADYGPSILTELSSAL
jgi:hypothetical protein